MSPPSTSTLTVRTPEAQERALQASQLDFFLIDSSGSMTARWWDFMAALDAYADGLKSASLSSRVIAATFGSGSSGLSVERDCHLSDWAKLHEAPIGMVGGMTALYDAINSMTRLIRDISPSRAHIVIVTDGAENDSNHTDATQARSLLDWLRAQGFIVTFMGCDFDNSSQAHLLGADAANSIGVATARLTDAAANLAGKRARHYHGSDDMGFSDEEKSRFGGYLAAPKS